MKKYCDNCKIRKPTCFYEFKQVCRKCFFELKEEKDSEGE